MVGMVNGEWAMVDGQWSESESDSI